MGNQLMWLIIPSGGTVLSTGLAKLIDGSGRVREGRDESQSTHLLTACSPLCCPPVASSTKAEARHWE